MAVARHPFLTVLVIGALGLSGCAGFQDMSEQDQAVAGATVGAVTGSVAGAQIAGNNNRTLGAILGGLLGAGAGVAAARRY